MKSTRHNQSLFSVRHVVSYWKVKFCCFKTSKIVCLFANGCLVSVLQMCSVTRTFESKPSATHKSRVTGETCSSVCAVSLHYRQPSHPKKRPIHVDLARTVMTSSQAVYATLIGAISCANCKHSLATVILHLHNAFSRSNDPRSCKSAINNSQATEGCKLKVERDQPCCQLVSCATSRTNPTRN